MFQLEFIEQTIQFMLIYYYFIFAHNGQIYKVIDHALLSSTQRQKQGAEAICHEFTSRTKTTGNIETDDVTL